MKKKMFFVILMVICLFGTVADVNAQEYKGVLSNIIMNGKHFSDVSSQSFTLIDKGNDVYVLIGEVGQIGKMPGSIYINLEVKVSNGVITPVKLDDKAGTLIVFNGLPINISLRNITGTLSSDHKTLHFTLETYAGWKLIPTFPASVIFNGTLQ